MRYINFYFICFLLFTACEMDDEERCSAPFEYRPAEAACVIPVDTDPPVLIDTSPVQEGLGAECDADSDCAVYAPDGPVSCLVDPSGTIPLGMCTFMACDYATCGGEFLCCDCEQSMAVATAVEHSLHFCADPGSAGMLTMLGCACN